MTTTNIRAEVLELADEYYAGGFTREEFNEYTIAVARIALDYADFDRGIQHATIGTLRIMVQAAVRNLRDLDTPAARKYANLLSLELTELFPPDNPGDFKSLVELLDDEQPQPAAQEG